MHPRVISPFVSVYLDPYLHAIALKPIRVMIIKSPLPLQALFERHCQVIVPTVLSVKTLRFPNHLELAKERGCFEQRTIGAVTKAGFIMRAPRRDRTR